MSSSTARQPAHRVLPALVAGFIMTACAAHEMPPPMPVPMPPQAPPQGPTVDPQTPPPAPEPQDALGFSPRWGAVGADVELTARDFEPGATVDIGFGLPGEVPQSLGTFPIDEHGALRASVRIPAWAQAGRVYSFYAGVQGEQPRLISEGFHLASPDGTVRVEGTLTEEGVECPALRSAEDRLYTLAGDIGDFRPGDRVVVEGTLPDMSTCMQGITVQVRSIRRADG